MLQRTASPPGARTRGWWAVAATLAGLCWALGTAALVLLVVTGEAPPQVAYWVMDVVSALVYGAALLVMLPRSRHPVAWILALVGLGCGVAGLLEAAAPLAGPSEWVWVWMPGTYASMVVLPWLVGPRARWATAGAAAGLVATALATLGVRVAGLGLWPVRAVVVLTVVGAGWLVAQRLRAPGDRGRGLGWLAVGELLMAAGFFPLAFLPGDELTYELSGTSLVAAQAFLPVALLVVVLRQRLWGVDVAVGRVTVWTLLTASVVVGYAGLAWLAARVLSDGVASLVAVGVVAALGQPLRWWIQGRVDRLVYGDRADPVALIDTLSQERDRLVALVAALRRTLRLGGVHLQSAEGRVLAADGALHGQPVEVPLTSGALLVSPVPGQHLDGRTLRQLDELRGVLAVALELAEANDRLEAGSSRLVEVRMEERRMLRRDLHDGMGPALAGVGLGLAAAQRRLHHDPEGTARLLAELEAELERRTDDVRLLARSLLPAQLDHGDLGRALEVLADRFAASGLAVTVDCRVAGLDTRHQLAVYHVAAEALLNAYRHAHPTRVDIAVARTGRRTVLEIRDDGTGIGPSPTRGVGLTSMRERAAELGGTVSVGPAADGRGTLVRMELP